MPFGGMPVYFNNIRPRVESEDKSDKKKGCFCCSFSAPPPMIKEPVLPKDPNVKGEPELSDEQKQDNIMKSKKPVLPKDPNVEGEPELTDEQKQDIMKSNKCKNNIMHYSECGWLRSHEMVAAAAPSPDDDWSRISREKEGSRNWFSHNWDPTGIQSKNNRDTDSTDDQTEGELLRAFADRNKQIDSSIAYQKRRNSKDQSKLIGSEPGAANPIPAVPAPHSEERRRLVSPKFTETNVLWFVMLPLCLMCFWIVLRFTLKKYRKTEYNRPFLYGLTLISKVIPGETR